MKNEDEALARVGLRCVVGHRPTAKQPPASLKARGTMKHAVAMSECQLNKEHADQLEIALREQAHASRAPTE